MKRDTKRLSRDGLPVDARDWTEADWRDLHEAVEDVKRKVAQRHAEQMPKPGPGERRGEGGEVEHQ